MSAHAVPGIGGVRLKYELFNAGSDERGRFRFELRDARFDAVCWHVDADGGDGSCLATGLAEHVAPGECLAAPRGRPGRHRRAGAGAVGTALITTDADVYGRLSCGGEPLAGVELWTLGQGSTYIDQRRFRQHRVSLDAATRAAEACWFATLDPRSPARLVALLPEAWQARAPWLTVVDFRSGQGTDRGLDDLDIRRTDPCSIRAGDHGVAQHTGAGLGTLVHDVDPRDVDAATWQRFPTGQGGEHDAAAARSCGAPATADTGHVEPWLQHGAESALC